VQQAPQLVQTAAGTVEMPAAPAKSDKE